MICRGVAYEPVPQAMFSPTWKLVAPWRYAAKTASNGLPQGSWLKTPHETSAPSFALPAVLSAAFSWSGLSPDCARA